MKVTVIYKDRPVVHEGPNIEAQLSSEERFLEVEDDGNLIALYNCTSVSLVTFEDNED